MLWQLLICITNLLCVVQGLVRLSDIICLGHSNPVNNNCFLFTFVKDLPTLQIHAYTCMQYTKGIPAECQGCHNGTSLMHMPNSGVSAQQQDSG